MSTVPGGIKPRKVDVYFDVDSVIGQNEVLRKEAEKARGFVEALSEFFGFLDCPVRVELFSDTFGSTMYKIIADDSGVGKNRKYCLNFTISGGPMKTFAELNAGQQAHFCKIIKDNLKSMIETFVVCRGKMVDNFRSASIALEEFFGDEYFEEPQDEDTGDTTLEPDSKEEGGLIANEPSRSVV